MILMQRIIGEDIIDVLYRFRDRSSSPMQRTLTRSRNVRPDDNPLEHQASQRRTIQQQVSAPPPPRNYERDLYCIYHFNRQSLAYRGRVRQSDSVFNRQTFNPSSQQSFYHHTRSRCNSDNNEDGHTANIRHGKSYKEKSRQHKSDDNLDIDFEKSRSIQVDVVPRLDVESKYDSDDLILMPNGTRQRRRKLLDSNAMTSTKTSLHRTDNQATPCLSSGFSDVGISQEILSKDEIYSTAAAVIESEIYENVQSINQSSGEIKSPIALDQTLRNKAAVESISNYQDSERVTSELNTKRLSRDDAISSNNPLQAENSPNSCSVHQLFEKQKIHKQESAAPNISLRSLKHVRIYTWTFLLQIYNCFYLFYFPSL